MENSDVVWDSPGNGVVWDDEKKSEPGHGAYRMIEDVTGIPQDVSSGFVSGVTAGNTASIPPPEDAGFVRKQVPGLLGMGVTFTGLNALTGGLGMAGLLADGAIYGAAAPAKDLVERAKNAATGGATMGVVGVGGALMGKVASNASPLLKGAIEKLTMKQALTGSEKMAVAALQYGTAGATGAGFGLYDAVQEGISDPSDIAKMMGAGAGAMALTHGITAIAKTPFQKHKEIMNNALSDPKLQTEAATKGVEEDIKIQQDSSVPPLGEDLVKANKREAIKAQAQVVTGLQKGLQDATSTHNALADQLSKMTMVQADDATKKPIIAQIKIAQEAIQEFNKKIAETQANNPISGVDPVKPKPIIPDNVARVLVTPREIPEEISLKTYNATKQTVLAMLRTGKALPTDSVRMTSVEEINSILKTGALTEGMSAEGKPSISAQSLDAKEPVLVSYGGKKNVGAAIVFPESAVYGKGLQPGETLIDPKFDVRKLQFIVAGHTFSYEDGMKIFNGVPNTDMNASHMAGKVTDGANNPTAQKLSPLPGDTPERLAGIEAAKQRIEEFKRKLPIDGIDAKTTSVFQAAANDKFPEYLSILAADRGTPYSVEHIKDLLNNAANKIFPVQDYDHQMKVLTDAADLLRMARQQRKQGKESLLAMQLARAENYVAPAPNWRENVDLEKQNYKLHRDRHISYRAENELNQFQTELVKNKVPAEQYRLLMDEKTKELQSVYGEEFDAGVDAGTIDSSRFETAPDMYAKQDALNAEMPGWGKNANDVAVTDQKQSKDMQDRTAPLLGEYSKDPKAFFEKYPQYLPEKYSGKNRAAPKFIPFEEVQKQIIKAESDLPAFDSAMSSQYPEAATEPREALGKTLQTQKEKNDKAIRSMLDNPGQRAEYQVNPAEYIRKHGLLTDDTGKPMSQFKSAAAQIKYVNKIAAEKKGSPPKLGPPNPDAVIPPTGSAPSRKPVVKMTPLEGAKQFSIWQKNQAKIELIAKRELAQQKKSDQADKAPGKPPILMPKNPATGERYTGHPEWANEPDPNLGRGTIEARGQSTDPELPAYTNDGKDMKHRSLIDQRKIGPNEQMNPDDFSLDGDFNATYEAAKNPPLNKEGIVWKVLPNDLPGNLRAWIDQWIPNFNYGASFTFKFDRAETVAAAEKISGYTLVDVGNSKDHELAAAIAAIVGNPERKYPSNTFVIGHGEGEGDGRKFVETAMAAHKISLQGRTFNDVANAYGGSVNIIACDALAKRNFSTAEYVHINTLKKAGLPPSPPPHDITAQSGPFAAETMAQADPSFLAYLVGGMRLADKYPVMTNKIQTMLEHSNLFAHKLNERGNEIRQAIYTMYREAGKHQADASFFQKLFGTQGYRSKEVDNNWQDWKSGKTQTPPQYEKGMQMLRNIDIRDHMEIVSRKESAIWADLKKPRVMRDADGFQQFDPEFNNPIVHDGKEGRPMEYEQDNQLKFMISEADKGNIDLSQVYKNPSLLHDLLKKYEGTTKDKIPPAYTSEDVRKAEVVLHDLKRLRSWGQDAWTFVHQAFEGQFKVIAGPGHPKVLEGSVLGSGSTAGIAREVAKWNLHNTKKGEQFDPSGKFTMTTTLHQMMEARGQYKADPEMHEEGTVAAITNGLSSWPRPDIFKALNDACAVMDGEMTESSQYARDRWNMDLSPNNARASEKWAAQLMKKTTDLRGEQSDPIQAYTRYGMTLEKKWSVDAAMSKIRQDLIDNPFRADQTKLKDIFEKKLEDFKGKYSFEDKEIDNIRLRLADFVDSFKNPKMSALSDKLMRGQGFGATRFANTYMGLTANMTMGYTLVKPAINRYGGVMHIIIKSSAKDYMNGRKFLATKEGKAIADENAHMYGREVTLTNDLGHTAADKWWKPLYLFQKAEGFNRDEAFATGYMKRIGEGATKAEARADAIKFVNLTQGIYAAVARPALISGPISKMSFQFKQYLINEHRFLSTLTKEEWAKYIPYLLAAGGSRGAILTAKSFLGLAGMGALLDSIDQYMNLNHPKLHRGIPGIMNMDLSAPSTWQLPSSTKEFIGKPMNDLYLMGKNFAKQYAGSGLTDKEISDMYRSVAPTAYAIHKGLQMISSGTITKGSHLQSSVPAGERVKEGIVNLLGTRSVVESQKSDAFQMLSQNSMARRDRFTVLMDDFAGSDNPMQRGAIIQKMVTEDVAPKNLRNALRLGMKNRNLPILMSALKRAQPKERQQVIQAFLSSDNSD